MTKTCPLCGKEFDQTCRAQKYCSKECSTVAWRAQKALWLKNFRAAHKKTRCVKACEICGKEFVARDSRQKYCSEECAKKAYNIRKAQRRRRASDGSKRIGVCKVCGKKFEQVKMGSRLYCSKRCANYIYAERARAAYKTKRQGNVRKYKRRKFIVPIIVPKTCKLCGKEFVPHVNNQRYCSPECRKEVNRRRFRAEYRRQREIKPFKIKRQLPLPEVSVCRCCGEKFKPSYPTEKFCSDDCRFEFFSPPLIKALVRFFRIK